MDGNYDTGRYTRIGRQVFVQGYIGASGAGSASGNLLLHGLPFTAGSGAESYNGFAVGWGSSIGITAGVTVSAYVEAGASKINFSKWSSTLGTTSMTVAELAAPGYLMFSGSYTI
jgi:hypothetical protein